MHLENMFSTVQGIHICPCGSIYQMENHVCLRIRIIPENTELTLLVHMTLGIEAIVVLIFVFGLLLSKTYHHGAMKDPLLLIMLMLSGMLCMHLTSLKLKEKTDLKRTTCIHIVVDHIERLWWQKVTDLMVLLYRLI